MLLSKAAFLVAQFLEQGLQITCFTNPASAHVYTKWGLHGHTGEHAATNSHRLQHQARARVAYQRAGDGFCTRCSVQQQALPPSPLAKVDPARVQAKQASHQSASLLSRVLRGVLRESLTSGASVLSMHANINDF